VKNKLIGAAIATVLTSLPMAGQAASTSTELDQIRTQLQSLMQRVEKLEGQNTELKSENDALKSEKDRRAAEMDYLKAQTRELREKSAEQSADLGKVKGADWAGKFQWKGDMRYRHEEIQDDLPNAAGIKTADRSRDRIRLRAGFEAKPTDKILVGVQLTTTERMGTEDNGDPRSSNQTLGNEFSRKRINLDLAYFDWKFASWGDLFGGKMKYPYVRPGQSLFNDNDVNPEGLALVFNRGIWFGSAYSTYVNEVSGLETTTTSDTMLVGAQVGARFPIRSSNLMVAVHYQDLTAGKLHNPAPFYNGSSNGNSTTTIGAGASAVSVLTYEYKVIELMTEFNTTVAGLPFQIWGDFAKNQDPYDLNKAWGAGLVLGKASNSRTWELGAAYEKHEKDALFGQLVDSDFGAGVTDSKGWILRGAYAPVKNWTLNATYFLNKRPVDVAAAGGFRDTDYKRLQLDFNLKF